MAQYRIKILYRNGVEEYLCFNSYDEARDFLSDTWDSLNIGCTDIVGFSPIQDIE